jgi:hypothetical protein
LNKVNPSNTVNKGCKATTAVYGGYTNKQIIPLLLEDAALTGRIENGQVKEVKLCD